MRIVLVRPRDPNNIGAAARAMANFGLSDLVVVAPYAPVWREARSAVGALAVLASAREAASLDAAVADCAFVGAATAGTHRRLYGTVGPAEFATEARAHGQGGLAPACLVFGNEKHGLTRDEVGRCHVAVRIPTEPSQPSMNLAQAVAVCCYEAALGRAVARAGPGAGRTERPATAGEIEALLVAAYPEAAEPGVEARRRGARARLRALLLRARATAPDVALVRGLASPGEPESDNDPGPR
jgi:tRNA/rRNA methyltransferase